MKIINQAVELSRSDNESMLMMEKFLKNFNIFKLILDFVERKSHSKAAI